MVKARTQIGKDKIRQKTQTATDKTSLPDNNVETVSLFRRKYPRLSRGKKATSAALVAKVQ